MRVARRPRKVEPEVESPAALTAPVEPKSLDSIYDLVIAGHPIPAAASLLGVPYVDAAKAFDEQAELNRPNFARGRDVARARLEKQLRACEEGIKDGDVPTLREARGIVEGIRKLDGLDAGPDTDAVAQVVKVEFTFGGNGVEAKDKTDGTTDE